MHIAFNLRAYIISLHLLRDDAQVHDGHVCRDELVQHGR